jgi:hypothetical protein
MKMSEVNKNIDRLTVDWNLMKRIDEWISNCDIKASAIVVINGLLLGFLATLLKDGIKSIYCNPLKIAVLVVSGFFALFFVLSILNIFKTLRADVTPRKTIDFDQGKLFHFFSIYKEYPNNKEESLPGFYADMEALSPEGARRGIIQQVHVISEIASKKFENFNKSLKWLRLSFFCWAIAILLFLLKFVI